MALLVCIAQKTLGGVDFTDCLSPSSSACIRPLAERRLPRAISIPGYPYPPAKGIIRLSPQLDNVFIEKILE